MFSGNDPLYSETSTYSGIPEAAPYSDMNDLTEKERQLADTEQSLEDSENLPNVSTLFIINFGYSTEQFKLELRKENVQMLTPLIIGNRKVHTYILSNFFY